MTYINTVYLFKCQTCRHFRSGECNTFCENGECYSPNMRMIPTTDVAEVKHGEWKTELDEFGWNKNTCTHCGYVKRTDIHVSLGWNFCPKCGADMRKGG